MAVGSVMPTIVHGRHNATLAMNQICTAGYAIYLIANKAVEDWTRHRFDAKNGFFKGEIAFQAAVNSLGRQRAALALQWFVVG